VSETITPKNVITGLYDGMTEWNGITGVAPEVKATSGYKLGYVIGTAIRWAAIYFGVSVAAGVAF
jgi:hypothetical protein